MRKATALLVTALGALALVGAGCSNTQEEVNPNEEKESVSTETPTSEGPESTEEVVAGEIVATAEALGSGAVSVKWEVPQNFDRTKSFRILHSARPNPSIPAGDSPDSKLPFWIQVMNSERSYELGNVTPGNRYIRVCAFDLEKQECALYSNEVQLEVK